MTNAARTIIHGVAFQLGLAFFKNNTVRLIKNFWLKYYFTVNIQNYSIIESALLKMNNEKNEDKLKSAIQTYKIPFKFDKGLFDYFVSEVRFYQDEVLPAFPNKWQMWLEDLTDEKLAEIFDVELQIQDESIGSVGPLKRIKYSSYYDPKELKLMQDTFEERFENEFQFYGYEYK